MGLEGPGALEGPARSPSLTEMTWQPQGGVHGSESSDTVVEADSPTVRFSASRWTSMKKRLLFVLLVAAPVVYVAWSRYTAYGILAGGGGRYWVSRAVAARADTEARAHLRRILGATQYGVNVAENAVRRLPRREDRIRMWRFLVELAPNDNWREIYQRHLDQERTGREPPHDSALPDADSLRMSSG